MISRFYHERRLNKEAQKRELYCPILAFLLCCCIGKKGITWGSNRLQNRVIYAIAMNRPITSTVYCAKSMQYFILNWCCILEAIRFSWFRIKMALESIFECLGIMDSKSEILNQILDPIESKQYSTGMNPKYYIWLNTNIFYKLSMNFSHFE